MTKIIAEAATNHNGQMSLAKEMIEVAADAGADFIKFQSWQTKTMDPANQAYALMKTKELSDENHHDLINHCQKKGIQFLTTCFDIERVAFLKTLGLTAIKIASTDVTSLRLLAEVKQSFPHIILSTGMSHPDEIAAAAAVLKSGPFTLMHCVSLYPTTPEKANLGRIEWLKQFSASVGYSDHTLGTTAPKAAISMGVTYLEKHFTLKRDTNNIFSAMSAGPADIKEICDWAKEFSRLRGDGSAEMNPEEAPSRQTFIGRWGDNR